MQDTMEVDCPWCGERFDTFYDYGSHQSAYIEDCHVCCRPIKFFVNVIEDGELSVVVDRDA